MRTPFPQHQEKSTYIKVECPHCGMEHPQKLGVKIDELRKHVDLIVY